MKLLKIGMTLGAAAVMAGCATSSRCPLGATEGQCASMMETYQATRAGGGTRDSVFSQAKPSRGQVAPGFGLGESRTQSNPQAVSNAQGLGPLAQAGRHRLAGPVYNPAKPYQMWVAPWTDANGLVHGGEDMYFVTPGFWSYGPMELPGSAGGLLGPAMPTDYGFEPVAPAAKNNGQAEPRIRNGIVAPEGRVVQ